MKHAWSCKNHIWKVPGAFQANNIGDFEGRHENWQDWIIRIRVSVKYISRIYKGCENKYITVQLAGEDVLTKTLLYPDGQTEYQTFI